MPFTTTGEGAVPFWTTDQDEYSAPVDPGLQGG